MNKITRFRPKAELDFCDILEWYKEINNDLGAKFFKEVDEAINIIGNHPKIGEEFKPNIRKYVLNKFPYILFYVEEESEIIILAIFHGLRNPSTLDQELK